MTAIYYDIGSRNDSNRDEKRRQRVFAGHVVVHAPTPATLAFCEFTRSLIKQAFGSRDPELAQFDMPVQEFAALLAKLKPHFIHHPESKRLICEMLSELGCDPQTTYFDTPRLRSSTSDNYLTTGIAYAFHPHRDTWYSAPMSQVNWWMPVYEVEANNVMTFHPQYWANALPNGSADYNYQDWTANNRFNAATHIGKDTRPQPKAMEPVAVDPDIRIVAPVGSVMAFSGAQLHSSVPNTSGRTRYSIDFRTVNVKDVESFAGAPNMDSNCTGTAMTDYLKMTDQSHLPQALLDRYLTGHPQKARWDAHAGTSDTARTG